MQRNAKICHVWLSKNEKVLAEVDSIEIIIIIIIIINSFQIWPITCST